MQARLTVDECEIAAKLAHASDNEQSAFFKVFLAEMRKCCETHFKFQTQLCYIASQLSKEDREDLTILGETNG